MTKHWLFKSLFILLLPAISFAGDFNPYLTQIDWMHCHHGLTDQPEAGPFSVFVFCDGDLGINMGVINTESAAGPGSIKLQHQKEWIWSTYDRFWQDRVWASDITSFAWTPDKTRLYVATGGIYGSGGLFELNLVTRTFRQIEPEDMTVSTGNPGQGYMITDIDAVEGKLFYKNAVTGEINFINITHP